MRVFPQSTIAHPWRTSLAYLAVCVYATILFWWCFTGPLLIWLVRHMGRLELEPTST